LPYGLLPLEAVVFYLCFILEDPFIVSHTCLQMFFSKLGKYYEQITLLIFWQGSMMYWNKEPPVGVKQNWISTPVRPTFVVTWCILMKYVINTTLVCCCTKSQTIAGVCKNMPVACSYQALGRLFGSCIQRIWRTDTLGYTVEVHFETEMLS
jgi:hypothetical protein